MDLFTPIVDEDKLHPNFKRVITHNREGARKEFLKWAVGFPDRDNKFIKEFQTTFNSSFWEVYLFAVFKEYSFIFNWEHASPDFHLEWGGQSFLVEAVTANAAQGNANEWDKKIEDYGKQIDLNILNTEATIRLANSLLGKSRKYQESYSKLAHVNKKPFVLAIAPFEQPFFNNQYDRPIKSLLYDYYVDEQEFINNRDMFPNGPRTKRLGFAKKDNGSQIELGFFNRDEYEDISAVIFSCTATWGKLDSISPTNNDFTFVRSVWGSEPNGEPVIKNNVVETITDGMQVYHNPYAKYPLSPEIFRREGVVQCYVDGKTGESVQEEVNRSLFHRCVMGLNKSTDF